MPCLAYILCVTGQASSYLSILIRLCTAQGEAMLAPHATQSRVRKEVLSVSRCVLQGCPNPHPANQKNVSIVMTCMDLAAEQGDSPESVAGILDLCLALCMRNRTSAAPPI